MTQLVLHLLLLTQHRLKLALLIIPSGLLFIFQHLQLLRHTFLLRGHLGRFRLG